MPQQIQTKNSLKCQKYSIKQLFKKPMLHLDRSHVRPAPLAQFGQNPAQKGTKTLKYNTSGQTGNNSINGSGGKKHSLTHNKRLSHLWWRFIRGKGSYNLHAGLVDFSSSLSNLALHFIVINFSEQQQHFVFLLKGQQYTKDLMMCLTMMSCRPHMCW